MKEILKAMYETPMVEVIEVNVEEGFATSSMGGDNAGEDLDGIPGGF